MKYTKLGKSDLTVSRICMGCMGFGDPQNGQHSWTIDISSATFIAAFTIGMLGVMTAKLVKCPAEIFAFPSLLPMIPGVYAYKTILALMQFMQENQDAAVMNRLIVDICKNGITAFFIIFSLVIGVAIPMLMFKRLSYTRVIKPGH